MITKYKPKELKEQKVILRKGLMHEDALAYLDMMMAEGKHVKWAEEEEEVSKPVPLKI